MPPRVSEAERWERETFARTPERDAPFSTISGEPVKLLYAQEGSAALAARGRGAHR